MCGICGVYGVEDPKLVKDMTARISHRGPDDKGFFFDKNIGLGQRRLSIIDLKTGKQPIFNENKSIVIMFNGEIYNFKQIKEELEQKGHKFTTNSDTESIVHAYEEYGFECVKKLNGMFAFAIWDSRKDILFIARDRLGIKPVYYAKAKDKFLFSSEIKSLLACDELSRKINLNALHEFVNLQYSVYPNTIFQSVKKLGAGSYLIVKKDSVKEYKYWSLEYNTINKPKSFFIKGIRKQLKDSVERRLLADVPLGSFLSGGIDSSIIVGLMSNITKSPVKTFSIGFKDKQFDETNYSRLVSDYYKTDHEEIIVDYDMLDYLPKMTKVLDEPLADAASIPTYILSKHAAKKVKVVLTGEGGDENFAGYPYYKYFKIANAISKVTPNIFFKKPLSSIAEFKMKLFFGEKRKTLWNDISSKNKMFERKIFGFEDNDSLFNKEVSKSIDRKTIVKKLIEPYFKEGDFLNNMQKWDVNVWLADDLLMKVDKTTMANSLEARVPFLDHEFMGFVASMPSKYKFSYRNDKQILKQAFKDILPKQIMTRKKGGFNVPVEQWFSNQYKKDVLKIVEENKSVVKSYFDYKKITDNINLGKNPIFTWRLTNFVLWHNNYLE